MNSDKVICTTDTETTVAKKTVTIIRDLNQENGCLLISVQSEHTTTADAIALMPPAPDLDPTMKSWQSGTVGGLSMQSFIKTFSVIRGGEIKKKENFGVD